MYVKIPFESTLEFKTNISEITKMSLEHDYNLSNRIVLGNFYVSGEYRAHEVSVNTDEFKYTLPFTVELRDDIVKDTLEFNIEDFSYDIVNNNSLKVNIEYSLKAEVKEDSETFERVNEDELNDELEFIDEFLNQEEIEEKEETEEKEVKEERVEEEEKKEPIEEITEEDAPVEDRLDAAQEKTIMETIKDSDDTFVTYHVHIVKESESIETIANIYSVPSSLIYEYNNVDSISTGDKILIPKADE